MKTKLAALLFLTMLSVTLFAQGYYMEYTMNAGHNVTGKIKMYAQSTNSRCEMAIAIPGMPGGSTTVTLALGSAPDKVYTLNEKSKTYTESSRSSSREMNDAAQSDYEVTVIGKEKAGTYNATHVKVKQKSNGQEQELWMSTDLADYQDFAKIKSPYSGKDNLNQALAVKGVSGCPVRIKTTNSGTTAQLDLVIAEKRTVATTMFSLNGYTKSSAPSATENGKPASREDMINQMQQQSGNPK